MIRYEEAAPAEGWDATVTRGIAAFTSEGAT